MQWHAIDQVTCMMCSQGTKCTLVRHNTYFNPVVIGLSNFSFSKFACKVTFDFLRNNTIVAITATAMIRRAAKTLDTDAAARTIVESPAGAASVLVEVSVIGSSATRGQKLLPLHTKCQKDSFEL